MLKKINDFLAGVPATLVGGVFLVFSFVLPRIGVNPGIDPAWVTVIISGIPLLYLAVWRIIYNPGISKISSALLITVAMFAAIAIGDLFAAGRDYSGGWCDYCRRNFCGPVHYDRRIHSGG